MAGIAEHPTHHRHWTVIQPPADPVLIALYAGLVTAGFGTVQFSALSHLRLIAKRQGPTHISCPRAARVS